MKKLSLILILAVFLNLAACGTSAGEKTGQPENIPAELPNEAVITDVPEENNDGRAAMLDCYRRVLEGIYYDNVYPDGSPCEYDGYGELSDNSFAIYDVDRDGKDELIISFTTSYMAGMQARVYGCAEAEDSVFQEFCAFPSLIYYDNGMIKAEWSHNQGKAGDSFWPYTLCGYDPETDSYSPLYLVDAWDSELDTENFPAEFDTDGAGIVFFIMPDEYDFSASPVSKSEYESWYASMLGDANTIQLPYQYLTEENINSIK